MSKYLIDGYNFLFRARNKSSSLEKNRRALLESLNEELAPLHLKVSIIFDGSDSIRSHAQRGYFENLEVIYTTNTQSADDYLVEKLEQARYPAHYTVVTSDRGLSHACRLLGAKTLTIKGFLQLIEKKQKNQLSKESKPPLRFSSHELQRLLSIFEKRLKE